MTENEDKERWGSLNCLTNSINMFSLLVVTATQENCYELLLLRPFGLLAHQANDFIIRAAALKQHSFVFVQYWRNCRTLAALHITVLVWTFWNEKPFSIPFSLSVERFLSGLKGNAYFNRLNRQFMREKWCISFRRFASLTAGILADEVRGDKSCGIKISWDISG